MEAPEGCKGCSVLEYSIMDGWHCDAVDCIRADTCYIDEGRICPDDRSTCGRPCALVGGVKRLYSDAADKAIEF